MTAQSIDSLAEFFRSAVPSKWNRVIAVLAVIVGLDRLTKWWAENYLAPRPSIEALPFFHLSYVQNTGAAFGMMRGANAGLAVLSVFLLGVMIQLRRRLAPRDALAHWGIALVMGGALGNLWDRLAFGYVIDFLDFRVWPVFNVADSCISVGAVCLALGLNQKRDR